MEKRGSSRHSRVRKLYRSRTDRVLGGVCGGLGEHLHIDPVIIRLLFVLLAFISGVGILLYLIAWVVIPVNPHEDASSTQRSVASSRIQRVHPHETTTGVVLLVLGLVFLFSGMRSWMAWMFFPHLGGFILLLLGLYLLLRLD